MRALTPIAIVLVVAGAAHAQSPAQKKKLAKQYVDAGLAAQDAKDYDTAISLYGKAYDLIPEPVLLFNIAQAHRLAGHGAEALEFYEQFLVESPGGPQAKIAAEFVEELHDKVEAAQDEQRRRDEEARQQAADAAAEKQKRETASVDDPDETGAPEEPDEAPEAPRSPGRGLRITGMVTGAAGVLGLGAAVVFGLRAKSASDDLSEPGAEFDPDLVAQGESDERVSIIAGIAGGALLVTGIALTYLGYQQKSDTRSRMSLVVTPDQVGVTASLRW
jgi:tetratricopeptide (TPR) repeat protein